MSDLQSISFGRKLMDRQQMVGPIRTAGAASTEQGPDGYGQHEHRAFQFSAIINLRAATPRVWSTRRQEWLGHSAHRADTCSRSCDGLLRLRRHEAIVGSFAPASRLPPLWKL
ncbi:hypothetical protein [Geminicoccus harenae]|uniref:hypothetical protein n=1 Tax=Geminicoccus harenae TaxID=2498453 RepID=UPI00168B0AB5|nr:hypothetical protein [Geminicoccus harenae]